MTFAYDITTYLLANGFTADEVYLNSQPNDRINCICVFDSGGSEAERMHGTCMPIERVNAQIKIRHESLKVAETEATDLYELLDDKYSQKLNTNTYMSINAVAPPYYLGVDQVTTKGQAHTYTLNLYGRLQRS